MTDDLADRLRTAPVDAASRDRLADGGLELRLVDPTGTDFAPWLQAMNRGFLSGDRTQEQIAASQERSGARRHIGVYDPTIPLPDMPVGTFDSWASELGVPGGGSVSATAISGVTVAPTHHRRGIARAMMEAELRTAASLGITAGVLTVSESTLYGRYGFAPAADVATWKIEPRRAGWTGPTPAGRVDFVSRERASEVAAALHERLRTTWPGELRMPDGHWERLTRTRPDAEKAGELRAVQYAGTDGDPSGIALYTVRENHDDFTKSTVSVQHLIAADLDAYAGLWRYLLSLDLVGTVTASELSVAEPLLWMIADRRAVKVEVWDHHYVRILDVAAALSARRYGAAGTLALDVADPLGIGGGRWILRAAADGTAAVEPWQGAAPADAVEVRLGVAELSAAYLGSVSLLTLAAAGRVETDDADLAARVFGWHVPARLSFWY
jgi:predicted acetyltransferase